MNEKLGRPYHAVRSIALIGGDHPLISGVSRPAPYNTARLELIVPFLVGLALLIHQ